MRSRISRRVRSIATVVIPSPSRSVGQSLALAAVQRDHRAVHEARALGGHEDGHVGHLLGGADAAKRNADLRPLLGFRGADVAYARDPAYQAVPALRGDRP